ncbi:hypothetical protein [Nocardiopsis ansamitocini]|nr:hypothetical protein [Nocardiopsis ansamitocini]
MWAASGVEVVLELTGGLDSSSHYDLIALMVRSTKGVGRGSHVSTGHQVD